MNIKLGDTVSAKNDIKHFGDTLVEKGTEATVCGFLLNSGAVDIMVETEDGFFLDQYPAKELEDHWDLRSTH